MEKSRTHFLEKMARELNFDLQETEIKMEMKMEIHAQVARPVRPVTFVSSHLSGAQSPSPCQLHFLQTLSSKLSANTFDRHVKRVPRKVT